VGAIRFSRRGVRLVPVLTGVALLLVACRPAGAVPPVPATHVVASVVSGDDVALSTPASVGSSPAGTTRAGTATTLTPPADPASRVAAARAVRDKWAAEGERSRLQLRNGGAAAAIEVGARQAKVQLDVLPRADVKMIPGLVAAIAEPVSDLAAEVALAGARDRQAIRNIDKGKAWLDQPTTAITAGLDQRLQDSAAWALAKAIDRDVPLLKTAAAAMPRTGLAYTGCDMVDQPPFICVSGPDDNTYPAGTDYALMIDLGGKNLYNDIPASARANSQPAAVMIDLGDDTTYTPQLDAYQGHTYPASNATSTLCLGAAREAIAFAVLDATKSNIKLQSSVDANCAGYGSAGVGVLLDNSGTSAWSFIAGASSGLDLAAAGVSDPWGLGIAVRRGALNAVFRPNPQQTSASSRLRGFGTAWDAVGLFYAGGGDLDLAETNVVTRSNRDPRPMVVSATGFGASSGGGVGLAILDDGGDKKVDLRAEMAAERSTPGLGPRVLLPTVSATTDGIGSSQGAGSGVLIDHGGTSTYSLSAALTGGTPAIFVGVPGFGPGQGATATGIGSGGTVGSSGVVIKDGPATYNARADTLSPLGTGMNAFVLALGQATDHGVGALSTNGPATYSALASATASSGSATPGWAAVFAEGTGIVNGVGMLESLGQNADTYTAQATRSRAGHPLGDKVVIAVQGAGPPADLGLQIGFGFLGDDGGCNHYRSDPVEPTQTGARVAGSNWTDGGAGYGFGVDKGAC
jgi:hypothetical protein